MKVLVLTLALGLISANAHSAYISFFPSSVVAQRNGVSQEITASISTQPQTIEVFSNFVIPLERLDFVEMVSLSANAKCIIVYGKLNVTYNTPSYTPLPTASTPVCRFRVRARAFATIGNTAMFQSNNSATNSMGYVIPVTGSSVTISIPY